MKVVGRQDVLDEHDVLDRGLRARLAVDQRRRDGHRGDQQQDGDRDVRLALLAGERDCDHQ